MNIGRTLIVFALGALMGVALGFVLRGPSSSSLPSSNLAAATSSPRLPADAATAPPPWPARPLDASSMTPASPEPCEAKLRAVRTQLDDARAALAAAKERAP